MTRPCHFDYRKAAQAPGFLAVRNGGEIDKLHALKLVFFADRYHLRKYGRPITNDRYRAMRFGPLMAPRWNANLTLRGGSVYFLQHRALTSPKPHFFVVLNADPRHDAFLVLTVASSKLDRVRACSANLPSETLVQVSPSEYADFQVESIAGCNHYFRVTKAELLQKLQAGLAGEMAPVPDSILVRLRRAMGASPLVEAEVKALLH